MKAFIISAAMASLLAGFDVKSAVEDAVSNGRPTVQLPAGRHIVTDTVNIRGAKNLTVDGQGSTIVFSLTDLNKQGFKIDNSENIRLKNFSIDYDPLPFTQGTISAMSDDGKAIEFRIHDGYPDYAGLFIVKRAYIFDAKTRRWKTGVADLYPREAKALSPRTGRIVLGAAEPNVAVGDLIAFTTRAGAAVNAYWVNGLRVEDVTIYTAGSIAVIVRFPSGEDNYFRFKVLRGARPAGAYEDRLMSTGADAFNYAYSRRGPVIENCEFEFMGDDSVNLHGVTFPVFKKDDARSFIGLFRRDLIGLTNIIRAGDRLRMLRSGNFDILDEAHIVSIAEAPREREFTREEVKVLWPTMPDTKYAFMRICADKDIAMDDAAFFDVPAVAAENFIIRNCQFRDHRGRGLRIMASKGGIENNVIERISQSAIALGPEYEHWREAGWPDNVVIRGNTLRDNGWGRFVLMSDYFSPGAISLGYRPEKEGHFPAAIRNITIESNLIDGSSVSAIHINAACDVLIRGNRIKRSNNEDCRASGSRFGLKAEYAVEVQNSVNVRAEGNLFKEPGGFCAGEIRGAGVK